MDDSGHIPASGGTGLPAVSVLICSKGRRRLLESVVAQVLEQEYPGTFEVVVIEETDSPRPIPGSRYEPIPVRNLGISFARNHAIDQAHHEVVVFIDDDSPPEPGWLERLVRPLMDSEVRGVAGGVSIPPCGPLGRAEHVLGFPGGGLKYRHRSGGSPQPTRFISTLNAAYRKADVLEVGGFPGGGLFAGEDQVLAARICGDDNCLFVPDAVVEHPPRGTVKSIYRWFFNRGRSAIVLGGELGWPDVLRMLMLPKLLGAAALGVGLALAAGWSAATGGLVGIAAFLLLTTSMALWRHRFALEYRHIGVLGWLAVAPVKLLMDLAFDLGALNQWLLRRGTT